MIKTVYRSSCKVSFLSDFNETWRFSINFRKILKTVFHENPSSEIRGVPYGQKDGRTDGHDEAKSRFSQFCERA